MRQAAREEKQGLVMELHPDRLIDVAERIFNGGDVFIERVATMLGLRKICDEISQSYRFKFNLGDYLIRMLTIRILHPGSKLSDFLKGSRYVEDKELRLENFYRSLDVLCSQMNDIQGKIYRNSLESIGRKTGVIYYECTNVFF